MGEQPRATSWKSSRPPCWANVKADFKGNNRKRAKTADAHKDCITCKDAGVLWLLGYPIGSNNTVTE